MDNATMTAFKITKWELDKMYRRISKRLYSQDVEQYGDEYEKLSELLIAIEKGLGVCSLAIEPPRQ